MRPLLSLLLLAAPAAAQPAPLPVSQPSPEAMAAAAAVALPPLPWHLANIWWEFAKPIAHFTSLEVDITIDRDLPPEYNLYISPCGIAEMNGQRFYGGLQTHINGWRDAEHRDRVHLGPGAIFSRWSADPLTLIGLDHVRPAGPDCLVESAGYEGEFASVRRPFAWNKGCYTWSLNQGAAELRDGQPVTWYTCRVQPQGKAALEVGSLRFEGSDFTYWAKHSAFVEVYSTAPLPRPGIPQVAVTFSAPRLNGAVPPITKASAFYPNEGGPDSPDCAWVKAQGDACVVTVGPIFKRDEAQRRHPLVLRAGPNPNPQAP